MLSEEWISIAQIVSCTEAEGPGKRFAIWFQGCPLRCPGCCNPEFLPFSGGEKWSHSQLMEKIRQSQKEEAIEGITLLGGEPFAHAAQASEIARLVQRENLSVMVFSGYVLEDLQAKKDPATELLLQHTDILVDGPYQRESPDTTRRWIGSTNQRIHFLTDRYHSTDSCWQQENTLEIRLNLNEISVNGFPGLQAKPLWQGKFRRKQS